MRFQIHGGKTRKCASRGWNSSKWELLTHQRLAMRRERYHCEERGREAISIGQGLSGDLKLWPLLGEKLVKVLHSKFPYQQYVDCQGCTPKTDPNGRAGQGDESPTWAKRKAAGAAGYAEIGMDFTFKMCSAGIQEREQLQMVECRRKFKPTTLLAVCLIDSLLFLCVKSWGPPDPTGTSSDASVKALTSSE